MAHGRLAPTHARSSGTTPPCTMPNCAWPALTSGAGASAAPSGPAEASPARSASMRARPRRAQRSVRSTEARHRGRLGRVREALVEHHRDVRSERRLDVDDRLGREEARAAIEVRLEVHAGIGDPPASLEAEDLVAAAVGEHRARPADEAVQAAAPGDQVFARAQVQVIGVAEDDPGAGVDQVLLRQCLDRALRADRHEDRRLDDAVGGREQRRGVRVRRWQGAGSRKTCDRGAEARQGC